MTKDTADMPFSLRLLGGFALARAGRPIVPAYEKGRALLAYLATEPGRAFPRARLAALFWPDLDGEAALANLRQVLHDLRRKLDRPGQPPVLAIDRDTVRLETTGLEIDTAAFSASLPVCRTAPEPAVCTPCLAEMAARAAAYRGTFLDGFGLTASPEFESWLQERRESLHLRALGWLGRLADCHALLGDPAAALPYALHYLELAPDNEEGLRRAMRLQMAGGQADGALALYTSADRRFARELGAPLASETHALADAIHAQAGAIAPARDPARRQVTVLYAELQVAGADPDTALAALNAARPRLEEIVCAQSGHLVPVHGACLLAYFGYPLASENAVLRAARTARILAAAGGDGLTLHVGLHTGIAIDSGAAQAPDATGSVTPEAQRLCRLAAAGTVALGTTTRRLLAGYFECLPLPGAKRTAAYRLGRETGATTRIAAAAQRGLAPLTGRTQECVLLAAAWQAAAHGARRAVALVGEAGIGKSRLVHAFRTGLDARTLASCELHCEAESQQSPFHPLAQWLRTRCGIDAGTDPAEAFARLATREEARYPGGARENVPLLARLLGLPPAPPYAAPADAPERQRERMLELLQRRLGDLARAQPLLLVVEDLHWADPSTLELLRRLLTATHPPGAGMLLLLTARPAFEPPWDSVAATTLELPPLAAAEMDALVAAVAPALSATVRAGIVARADGIPLFAEELARDATDAATEAVPATLHDLLAVRLDALGPARRVALAAAALGREFDAAMLAALLPSDGATLGRQLDTLGRAGILMPAAAGRLQFRHALIRDAAYAGQMREERRALHRRIAAIMQAQPQSARPELRAWHWSAGGEIRRAVACWIEAGQRASRDSASSEAVSHFRAGLALLAELPDDAERVRHELDLQIGLGAAACAAEGYASAAGAAAYARAMALCDARAATPDMFYSVWGLWASASSRAGYADARRLAERLVALAPGGGPLLAAQAHFALGNTQFWQGEFAAALGNLNRALAVYRPALHVESVAGFGEDVGVTAGAYRAWVLWFAGDAVAARAAGDAALALARHHDHPFSLAYALSFVALLHCRLREPETALALADAALALADSHGFRLWQLAASVARGWAQAQQGEAAGIEAIGACVEAMRSAMGGVTQAVLEPLADACLCCGRHAEALAAIDAALAVGEQLGDRHASVLLQGLRMRAQRRPPRRKPGKSTPAPRRGNI